MTMPLKGDYLSSHFLEVVKKNEHIEGFNTSQININFKDKEGRNALFFAIKNNHIENVQLLIDKGVALMVSPLNHALFHAIKHDSIKSVQYLIKKGISVNIRNEKFQTPLMMATYHDRVDICRFLLNQKADMFLMDNNHDMAVDFIRNSQILQDIYAWRMMAEEKGEVVS